MLEIETIPQFEAYLRTYDVLENVVFQGLDLTEFSDEICSHRLKGVSFLGCQLEHRALDHAYQQSALIFPRIPDKPFSSYRGALYTVDELFCDFDMDRPESYENTLDAKVYRHWQTSGRSEPVSIMETLARRLHDHAISDAVHGLMFKNGDSRRAVAIMGGHSMKRDHPDYIVVAKIARALTRQGFFLLSGGGPGAMEATHLGAWFATRPDHEMEDAVKILSLAPHYSDKYWLSRAFEVRRDFPLEDEVACASLGIPTWLYGHEPPNPFATHIAKYFANSIREEGLLTLARYGVVFAPGAAGTIQEIFQDACQNRYKTTGLASPMIFFGEAYWKWKVPVFPLIAQLAIGKEYGQFISITDELGDIVKSIESFAEKLDGPKS
jgi:predicted Rossmann-fold nucleotide-binding protein